MVTHFVFTTIFYTKQQTGEKPLTPLLLLVGLPGADVMLFGRQLFTLAAKSLQVDQPALQLLKVPLQLC